MARIGLFDSGIGGLSVLSALRALRPDDEFIYVADQAFAPYGTKEPGMVLERARALCAELVAFGVDAVVVACNTATVIAIAELRRWATVPIIGIEPAIKPAADVSRTRAIGVMATPATLQSAAVARLSARYAAGCAVELMPCPGLVERIEAGDFDSPDLKALVQRLVGPLLERHCDVIVLGCTHYPLIRGLIAEFAGPEVTLLDPAPAIARELCRRLDAGHLAHQTRGTVRYFSTGDSAAALRAFTRVLGTSASVAAWPPAAEPIS